MKKRILVGLGLIAVIAFSVGLFSYAPAPATIPGSIGGPYYINAGAYPIAYGKVDTIKGAATDSFKMPCTGKPTSITFSNNIWKCAGTPTVTVALYASADGGVGYGTAPIATYTVNPTALYSTTVANLGALVNTYIVNNPYGGNPYTNYLWVTTNSASSTMSCQGTVMVR